MSKLSTLGRRAAAVLVVHQTPRLAPRLSFTPIRLFCSRPTLSDSDILLPSSSTRYLTTKIHMPSSPTPKSKVLVLGAGNFGSCLADHLGDCEHEVYMWSRDDGFVEYFNAHHRNPTYLKDHVFSSNICAVGPEIPDQKMIQRMDVLLFAIPTQGVRYDSLASGCSDRNKSLSGKL